MILNSPYITGSITITGNANIQGTIAGAGVNSLVSTSSYNADSSSFGSRITNLEATSSTVSSSYAATSASISSRVKDIEDQYATTGSNTFTGTQNITNTTQPTNFDSTAALYTAGGLRVKGNVYVSSSLYLKGDLTVYGTQSINYITSSQLDISDNIINVNTATPGVRFGGIAVYDSGSTGLTGSLLWDSQNNNWIYSNPSGSGNYDSAMVLMGPQNSSGLGSEVGITFNSIPKGVGGHHMTSSIIFESSSLIGIGTTSPAYKLDVNGNGRFSSQLNVNTLLNILKTDNSTVGAQVSYDSNVNQLYLWNNISSGYFSVYTNSTERLSIKSNGDVNITNTGSLNLHGGYFRLRNNAGSTTYGLFIQTATWKGTGTDYSPAITAETGYGINFFTNGTATERMTIASDGKVGIGITNPGYKLTVVTDSTAAISVQATNATVGSPILDYYDNGRSQETVISSTDGTTTGTYIASYSNHPLLFGAYANSTPTAKMVITQAGNVGINTSSPTSILHIGATTSGNQKLTHWGEPGFTANYGLILRGDSSDGVFKFYGLNNGSESSVPNLSMNRASANSTFGGTYISTYSRLNVNGSVMMNRSKYNWYQGYWTGNSTYWHMKTNLWGGGSPNGNTMYTMSLFKGYMYSYGDSSIREGGYGFHNWVGTLYNPASTGNLFTTAYVSSDGYVVLVIPSGSGETGVTIDWHQAYGYPFAEAQVTAAKLYGATTGGY